MNIMTAKLARISSLLGSVMTLTLCAQQAPNAPAATAQTPAAAPAGGPKIQFEMPVYDFGKIKAGEPVKYTFIFTNVGTELLILTNVQPSCGCTAAGEWTRQVEPGKTGSIPIQFNSANYGGQVVKTVTVTCNDKSQPSVGLQIKGTIWKPIDVNPQFAVLTIPPDSPSNVTTRVHIVNNMEELVTLSPPEVNNSKSFTAELKTNTVGKDFDLMISSVPPYDQPNLQAQITLKTSSTNVPTLTVTAWANVQQAIVVNPPHIMVGMGPLTNKQTVALVIQNNTTNLLKLSEPKVEAKDVEVQIAEPVAGRSFNVTLGFPVGFELPQGAKSEFTVKSDNPRHPVIKVPITQMAKPNAIVPAGIPVPTPSPATASKSAAQ